MSAVNDWDIFFLASITQQHKTDFASVVPFKEHCPTVKHSAPCILTIGGLDPSGGAGLPADARAVAAWGGHACGVATAVIAQNTIGVARVTPVTAAMVDEQLKNLLADIVPRAVKIGMLPNAATVKVVARHIRPLCEKQHVPLVLDTVFAPSSGAEFSDDQTVEAIAAMLLPMAEMVTPNIGEAARLLGWEIRDRDGMRKAAAEVQRRYGTSCVLLKGGHFPLTQAVMEQTPFPSIDPATPDDLDSARPDPEVVCDALDVFCDGERVVELKAPYIHNCEVRGTGCHLASALAVLLALGIEPLDASWRAKTWLRGRMLEAVAVGTGRRVMV